MVGNETANMIFSYGSISDYLLVIVTALLVIVTYLLYRSTNQQKNITHEIGKTQLSLQSNLFKLQRYESELKEVIDPLNNAIQLHKAFINGSKHNSTGKLLLDNHIKPNHLVYTNFWFRIESYIYLCPDETKLAISNFMSLRTTNRSEEDETIREAREELIKKVEMRYKELNAEIDSLLSRNSSIMEKVG